MDLRFFRVLAGITQRELGRQVGFSQSKIHLIEAGYCFASEDEKARIAEVLRVPLDSIEWPKKALVDGKQNGAPRVE